MERPFQWSFCGQWKTSEFSKIRFSMETFLSQRYRESSLPATRMGLYCVSEERDEGGNLAKTSLCFTIQLWETKDISDKIFSFPLIFYQTIHGKIKEQEGRVGKRGQAWVSWPGRLPWLRVQEFLSLGTWRLSVFLVDEFSGPQRSYGPRDAFCGVYTCSSLVSAE